MEKKGVTKVTIEEKREKVKQALLLYGVTDRTWVGEKTFEEQVEDSLKGGVTCIQLREKTLNETEFLEEAKKIKKLTQKYQVPLIINDNVEIALASDADGVHVGQKDAKAMDVRKKLGADKIIGVSARTVEQAKEAEQMGADYLGVGAVFGTTTKGDANKISLEILKEICKSVSIPVVAIGGVCEENILQLKDSGVAGVAVVSGIYAKSDIKGSSRELAELAKEIVK